MRPSSVRHPFSRSRTGFSSRNNLTTWVTMTVAVILVPFQASKPLESHTATWDEHDNFQSTIQELLNEQDFLETPLLRPSENSAGLYAYGNVPDTKEGMENVRATRLAMACGLLSLRFWGDVLLVRSFGGRWEDLLMDEISFACCVSPDIRPSTQKALSQEDGTDALNAPKWLEDAAQRNYHDGAELAKVISAMQADSSDTADEESDVDSEEDDSDIGPNETSAVQEDKTTRIFVAKSPLCLHCRGLSSELCPGCEGAYFCPSPRNCRHVGWSHSCLCSSWRLYSNHREELSSFGGFFGDWQTPLTARQFQMEEAPYEEFLQSLGIGQDCESWWSTEIGGWGGGQSSSASSVDAFARRTYAEGFSPITDVPAERSVSQQDIERAGLATKPRNSVGLLVLSSWKQYYALRQIPETSPVALLCTFPLSIYLAIERYGEVPVTVARMLKRPLRIHVVGAEKEMNFLDLFKEVSYLLPEDLQLEIVFIVREDMLPSRSQGVSFAGNKFSLRIEMTSNLTIGAVGGTYGGSLDPNFDCGTGPPDMVVALNAGIYAYESWRSVVSFLHNHSGVVGVFTDYNEYSGVNCAALGGGKSRNSLAMNPFRQPRAMPVYSMNLPQFSNGFVYVFNEQELE